jgi:hypothetical protein
MWFQKKSQPNPQRGVSAPITRQEITMTDRAHLNLSLAADAAINAHGYCCAAYWSDESREYLRKRAIESLRTAAAALGFDLVEAQQVQEHDRLARVASGIAADGVAL